MFTLMEDWDLFFSSPKRYMDKNKFQAHYDFLSELLPEAPEWVKVVLAKQHYDCERAIARLHKENCELKAKYSYGQNK